LIAALFVAPHIPGYPLNLDSRLPEVFEAPPEILGVAPKLHDDDPLLPGIDGGLEEVELQVVILDQAVDDRLIHHFIGKPQH
jgi:hypothetical protein